MLSVLLLVLLLAAPPLLPAAPDDGGGAATWTALACRPANHWPPQPSPALLLTGCSLEEVQQVVEQQQQQVPTVISLWLQSLTLSQHSHGRRQGSVSGRDCAAAFPRLTALKISGTALGAVARGLAPWLSGSCPSSPLEQLDLSGCSGGGVLLQVTELAGQQLRRLNLSDSQLSQLPEGAFRQLPQLAVLDLSHNRLARLAGGLFVRNTRLTHLHLQHNTISALTKQSFLGIVIRW
jgi:Leucine-rich repeat (LRR) protein